MTENDKYRNAHYPDLHPCVDGCKYWRPLYNGVAHGARACHYNIVNDELRGDYPDLEKGTCSKFEKGKSCGKRTNPYVRVSKR